jgi:hypothetical protein
MSILNFEEPPADALSAQERVGGPGMNIALIERQLRANPGKWVRVYGTDDVPAATKSVAGRWDKKPGFETRRKLVEESKRDGNGKKRPPSAYRYDIWIVFNGDASTPTVPESEVENAREVPILPPTPKPFLPPRPDLVPAPQAADAESLPAAPPPRPATQERYNPDAVATGQAEFV